MKKEFSNKKLILFTSVVLSILSIVILVVGELCTRILVDDSPYKSKAIIDSEFGWITEANSRYEYDVKDKGSNKSRRVIYTTSTNGFRFWGNINSDKPKIFFVGDSFVQSVEVDNNDTFYKLIADSLDVELFAYGQAGYGTLQELMIIEKYIAEIDPDFLVLQTCSNDFIDNSAEMEYNSNYKVGLKRPYMQLDSSIVHRLPIPRWQELMDKSQFLKLLRRKIFNLNTSVEESTERKVNLLGRKYERYDTSIRVTEIIISKLRSIIKDIPVIVMSASIVEPYTTDLEKIMQRNEIDFVKDPAISIDKLKWDGVVVNSSDGYHWNQRGHQAVANSLINPISKALNLNSRITE